MFRAFVMVILNFTNQSIFLVWKMQAFHEFCQYTEKKVAAHGEWKKGPGSR
jgi:hypothetical protein